jgi:membrane-associated phospholipid phosphatase
MMRKNGSLKSILLLLLLTVCSQGKSWAQADWEVNAVRNINPQNPGGFWKGISNSAKPLAVGVPLGMLAIGLIDHNKDLQYNSYEILGGLAITTLATEGLKHIIDRPRPYWTHTEIYPDAYDDSPSMPSGHVSVAFSTATSLAFTSRKWYVIAPAFTWAGLVGYSRLYMGQHYPSDVMLGAVVGAGGAIASHYLRKAVFSHSKKKAVQN